MIIGAISGPTPEPEDKQPLVKQDGKVTLSSIFDKDSDGGEEVTQKEYEQLSAEDQKTVDVWRTLVTKFIGEDAKLTMRNLLSADIQSRLEKDQEETLKGLEHGEAMLKQQNEELKFKIDYITNFASRNNMETPDVMAVLSDLSVDVKACSAAELVDALKGYYKMQQAKNDLDSERKEQSPKFF